MKLNKSTKYRFQWGEQQSLLSAEFWTGYWGGYVFGNPKLTDYIVASEKKYLDTYASIPMLKEMHTMSKKFLNKKFRKDSLERSKKYQKKYWLFYQSFDKIDLSKALSKSSNLQFS